METIIGFKNGVYITYENIKNVRNSFFEILKKELPKEALNYECISYIIDSIDEELKSREIVL